MVALATFVTGNAPGIRKLSGDRTVWLYWWFAANFALCSLVIAAGWWAPDAAVAVVHVLRGIVLLATAYQLWRGNHEAVENWTKPAFVEKVLTDVRAVRADLDSTAMMLRQRRQPGRGPFPHGS